MSSKSVLISVAFAWSLLSANVGLGQAVPGGVVGPLLMLDATSEIHLNAQVNNSPGSTYVPGDDLTLGATAVCSVHPNAPENYKFTITITLFEVFNASNGQSYEYPTGASDSNSTAPDHVSPGADGYVGGVVYWHTTSLPNYRGVANAYAQGYEPASGTYAAAPFLVASQTQTFTCPGL